MAAPRTTIAPDKQAIKAADKALIRAAGGVEAASLIARVGKSLLSEYGRPDNECFMPGDVRADLEAVTHGTAGHPLATRHAARALGYVLVAEPSGALPTGAELHRAIAEQARAGAALTSNVVEALGDGRIDRDEARDGITKCNEQLETAVRLRALLEQIAEAG